MNKIYIVGLGPGGKSGMTEKALDCLEGSDVIIGYTVYIELISGLFPGKELLSTPMRREEERCRLAFEKAGQGKRVAVVCSGDAGIYGMSGLMYELLQEYPETELEVVPGVTAASGGAAILGAPLMHDFAVISLSDLLTPWEKIEKRLECAAEGDFVICLYNPASRSRPDYLQKACDIIMRCRKPETVCGIAHSIGREGESAGVMSLAELRNAECGMFSTVFIGNSETRSIGGKMVTPRGYIYG